MADTDPLVAVLQKANLTDAQRAGLWDLYQAAKNQDDLAERLKSLQLPDDIKADLWDLKAGATQAVAEPEPPKPTEPSEGYWEDRGIAGKVWHPASGVKEGNRVDNSVLGVPPELAAVGAANVGRAIIQPGLKAAGRVAAGAMAAAGQAAPIIKYEAAHQALRGVGVPEPFASIGAAAFGARGGKKAATPEGAATPVDRGVLGTPKPVTESPLELTRRLKAEHRAANPLPKAETVEKEFKSFFQSSAKPKLAAQETAMAMKLLKGGLKSDEVMDAIVELRKMPVSWRNLPTDAEVAAIIAARNAARHP